MDENKDGLKTEPPNTTLSGFIIQLKNNKYQIDAHIDILWQVYHLS